MSNIVLINGPVFIRLRFSARWSAGASFRSYCRLLESKRARVHWTGELATKQSWFEPGWLFDLGLSSATGLARTDARRWSFETNHCSLLGWDQSGTRGLGHRSVVTTCECSYSGTRWTHWTFVRLILYSMKTFIVRAIRFLKLFRPNAKSWHLEFQTFICHGISLKMTHRWLMAFS